VSGLVAAIAFLTRVPVEADGTRTGAAAFAVVGAVLGLAAAVPVLLLGGRAPLVAGLLAVAVIAVASGVLHLDGLADTADALAAPDRARADVARHDPRIGAAGAVAVVVAVGIQAADLATLAAAPSPAAGPIAAAAALVVAVTTSRAAPVIVAGIAGPSAGGNGLGAWFAGALTPVDAATVVVTVAAVAVAAAVLVAPVVVLAALAGACLGVVLSLGVVRLRGGVDGDGLGATVELTQLAALTLAAVALS
jgi:adenosylcobinamide-GDP ribazoletransferase